MRFYFSAMCLFISAGLITAASAHGNSELVGAAQARLKTDIRYDASYTALDYPGGDVAPDVGVCTDVIIRSYRAAFGFDFQKAVHEDMREDFSAYPNRWGLKRPDKNIDHRRVPNLETYLKRQGASRPLSKKLSDYKAGDILTFRLGGSLPHIGIVSNKRSRAGTPLIIHNVGAGPKEEDVLWAYQLYGHYRFFPEGN